MNLKLNALIRNGFLKFDKWIQQSSSLQNLEYSSLQTVSGKIDSASYSFYNLTGKIDHLFLLQDTQM